MLVFEWARAEENLQVKNNFFIHFWNLLLVNRLSNHDDANIFICEREK